MSYTVDYNALKTVLDGYKTAVTTCIDGIASVMEHEAAIEASTNISGNNADRMKEYLNTVYLYAGASLNTILQLFLQNFMVYVEAYYEQIDSAADTCIKESELSDRYASLQGRRNFYQQIGHAAEDSVRKISDLVQTPNLDISSADTQFSKILTSLDNLDGDINSLERTHASSDFIEIDALISKLETFFLEVVKQDKNFKTSFSVENFLSLASVPGLITTLQDVNANMTARSSDVSLALNKLENRLTLERLKEQEEFEKRQEQAKWAKIGVNVVVGVVSAVTVVACPVAAPVVGMVSGFVTSSFSAAADEYTKHGMAINEWDKGRIGAHAIIGTTTGLIGGFVPAGAGLFVKASVKGLSSALEGAATTSYDQLSTYGRIVDTREILVDSATKGGAAFTGSLIGGAVSSNVKGVGISAIDLSRDDPLSKMHGLSVFLFEGGKSASTGIISRGVSGLTSQVIANSSDGTFVTPSELDLTAISSDMFSPESIGKDFVGSGLSGAAGDYVKLRTPDKDTGLTPIIQYKLGHTPDPETGTAPVVDEALKSLEKKEQWEKTHLTDWHSTDWENTASSPEEILQLEEMERNGELGIPETDFDLADPQHRKANLPSSTGSFSGEPGNSSFYPNNQKAVEMMRTYGQDYVDYKNNAPDFRPFTKHDSPWGKLDCQVEIGHMTDQRENPSWEFGARPHGTGHDPNYDLGNFAQADNALLEKIRESNPEATLADVSDFKKANNLTWHECSDGKTMQLVPTAIHDASRHSGGVSEMKYRMAWGDITRPEE